VFFLSGVLHTIAEFGGGLDDLSRSGTLMFYCMQPLGIILEDGAQAAYRPFLGTNIGNGSLSWTRLLGYIWVVGFLLFWTTPMWFVPMGQATVGGVYANYY